MSTDTQTSSLTVALIGNPNTGKSTLFNAISGVHQKTGNYPGVTVEKKHGTFEHQGQSIELIDLPGTYSLAPRSPDEMITVDVLLGRNAFEACPDAVLVILDASNLERNLYLVSQVLELGLPTLLTLNMGDVAQGRGITIDVAELSKRLEIPVVEIQANKGKGLEKLKTELTKLGQTPAVEYASPFPDAFQSELAELEKSLVAQDVKLPSFLIERLLLDTSGYLETELHAAGSEFHEQLIQARDRLKSAGVPVPAVEAMSRYGWVTSVLDGIVTREKNRPVTFSDKLDKVLTNRWSGSIAFLLIMLVVFQSIFSDHLAGKLMGWIEAAFGALKDGVSSVLAEGPLESLLVDGVIAGVGGVLVFLPQICILFFFIALLEDCGYMARAAYLMDKLFSKIGLSGKSFIPLLSSFACAIPGVMAARVIENRRDRLITILVAPLMSCSARLPVYLIMIGAFMPKYEFLGGWLSSHSITMFSMYMLGIVTAVLVAWLLKSTILKGPTPPFVMELPSYKLPSIKTVSIQVAGRAWAFIRRAGTLIFAASIIVWAISYYPRDQEKVEGPYSAELEQITLGLVTKSVSSAERELLKDRQSVIEQEIAGKYLRNSLLGQSGQFIEPVVKPLGWDWRIGCATIASFPAREVIISTLGVIYDLGGDVDEESDSLRERLQDATWDDSDEKVYNIPVALSIMVFFALCAQCAATLAVIKRETNSWRWPIFTFCYMTTLAYVGAFITYQGASWFLAA
ncbi:MAG: ferrous iron transport protein B [Blastopirellula sp.]|nr:MAG: ferrous iron transport protein B [Blastopirellula sp.]